MRRGDFYQQAEVFLQNLFEQANLHKVELQPHWSIDHLCFRVQSLDAYEKFKKDFAAFGEMLIESLVNGRLIATFKLQEPVLFHGYSIDLVELPAPKAGKRTPQGFEHVEVIVDQDLNVLKKSLSSEKMDEGGLKKIFNQELEFEMSGCALKFHPLSLESVINLEKNRKVHRALLNSRVLEILKPYNPLVAGTFPLGLEMPGSDLDILANAEDLDFLSNILQAAFSGFTRFDCSRSLVDKLDTLIVRFHFEGVPFEIFAQEKESIRQKAYLHFQAEEKLLKLGGKALHQKVMLYRQKGLKTESAFAQALNLTGDPYLEILNLQIKSEAELNSMFSSIFLRSQP